jgi:transposase
VVRRNFTMRDIAEILIHWQAGRSLRQIAHSLGVDRNTVRKYVALASSLGYQPGGVRLSLQEWSTVLQQHATQLVDPASRSPIFEELGRYHAVIADGLESNHTSTVWQRLCTEQGLQVSRRSFYRYIDTYFPEHAQQVQPTVLRDDPPPGQEAQVDFGYLGLWPDPLSGKARKLWAFCMVLAYSRHMFITMVTRLDQQAWIEAHVAAFAFFGGTPAILVIDNLKPGVLRPDLYDPQINRGYAELAAHYGVLIDPCRAHHPKDKPRVERLMPYIRDSFFAGRTFTSLEEMNQAGEKWCLSVAGERLHGSTHQRPLDLFQRLESSALRPLPAQPFEAVTWTQAKVARDCHVQVAHTLYSVPYHYIGQTLAVRISARTLEFYLDQALIKTHVRAADGRRQTDWQDYPDHKARFFQRAPDWCRLQAQTLGTAVTQVVEELLSRHALHYLRQCQGIIGLAEKYGAARLNVACEVAVAFGDPAYRTVRNLLEKGLEGQSPLPLASRSAAHSAAAYLHGPEQLFAPDSAGGTPRMDELDSYTPERKDSHA